MLAVYKLEKENGDAGKTWPVLQTARERVYALGRLIRMGTNDVVVDRGASVIRHGSSNLAYYPYGEEQGGASANDRAKFATYTRDASTGLDYAWNRMYKTEWGRFTSADPWEDSSRMTQPAGWNRFAYVGGDPVNLYDPPGLDSESVPGGPASVPEGWKPDIIINKNELIGGSGTATPIPSVFAGALGGEQPGPVYEVDIDARGRYSTAPEPDDPRKDAARSHKARIMKTLQDCLSAAASAAEKAIGQLPSPVLTVEDNVDAILTGILGGGVTKAIGKPLGAQEVAIGIAVSVAYAQAKRLIGYISAIGKIHDAQGIAERDCKTAYYSQVEFWNTLWGRPENGGFIWDGV